ncbi:MAG: DUF2975 domain-containing protein [Oscillospiraceae bacterium]|nr:DUF2975 domain-containing protein [Oscillospiraceae bacterium]
MSKIKWTDSMSLILSSSIIKVLAVIFIAAAVYAPFGLKGYAFRNEECNPAAFITVFYVCALMAFTALFFLNKLIANIRKSKIFIHENTKILRILSWCCYFAGIATAVYSFWEYHYIVIGAAAAFFGLILRVLKNVFAKAVEMREENDGTI